MGEFEDSGKDICLSVILHVEKNPDLRALQILFKNQRKTAAYVLLEVSETEEGAVSALVLRGMWIDEQLRGAGMSKVLMAVWVLLCLKLEVAFGSKVIDKPLISLALLGFDFKPLSTNVSAELCCDGPAEGSLGGHDVKVVLWSENKEQLQSSLSWVHRRNMHMSLTTDRPKSSRTIYLNTTYREPDRELLRSHALAALKGKSLRLHSARVLAMVDASRTDGGLRTRAG